MAPLGLAVRVALEALKDVVGRQPQFGGALGGGDGAHPAAAQQHQFLAARRGLAPVSLQASPGEVLLLSGPSGSGGSSTTGR